jgi:ferredoxin-NADP reductase
VTSATPSIRLLTLRIDHPAFRFLPGQWIELTGEIDGSAYTAGYSMTNSPVRRGQVELAITGPVSAPLGQELTLPGKLLHSVVQAVHDVQVFFWVKGYA